MFSPPSPTVWVGLPFASNSVGSVCPHTPSKNPPRRPSVKNSTGVPVPQEDLGAGAPPHESASEIRERPSTRRFLVIERW